MPSMEEKKIIKRNKILDAASALFMDKSFATTAIDDVVKMAGVAKGTFYLYFKDKYDLLDQIVERKTAEVLRQAIGRLRETPGSESMSLRERVIFTAEYAEDYLASHRELAALLSRNLANCFRRFVSGADEELSQVVSVFTQEFVAAGFTESRARMIIYLITETIGSVYCDAVLGTGPFTPEEIKAELNSAVAGMTEAKNND